jgi:hypothetical protein
MSIFGFEDDCFPVVSQSSLVEIDRCFIGAYCFHHQDDRHNFRDSTNL